MNWVTNDIHFVIARLCQKRVELLLYLCNIGWTLKKYFMHCWLTFRQYLCFMQVFMPYWNFDYTKAVTLCCGKSGR